MNPHPNPFPGKLRPSANTKKEMGEGKISKEPTRLTTIASRHRRQNRVFGTVRSANATVEKPPQEKARPLKQLKPSGIPKKLPNKDASKTEPKKEPTGASREDAKDAARRAKPETKRSSVRFQDQQRPPEKGCASKGAPEEAPRTPMSSIKPTVLLGTPYHSAQSCSKCRFDRLESAPYWLAQIKLAESVGKHFVSAPFFRLALECNAEPIRNLKSELKRYMARHSSLHMLAVWKEVCRDYGLLDGESSLGVIGFDPVVDSPGEKQDPSPVMQQELSGDCKDGCSGGELGGIPQSDLLEEDSSKNGDSTIVELNNGVGENPSDAVIGDGANGGATKPSVNVSEDNLMQDKTDDSNAAQHYGNKNSITVTTPGENFLLRKSERGSGLSSNDSSSVRKKVQPHSRADGSRKSKSQAASESCGRGTGKSKDEIKRNQNSKEGGKKGQNSRLKGASNVDENSIKISSEIHNAVALESDDDNQGSQ